MTVAEMQAAEAAAPAPEGYCWTADPAATGWRMRLWRGSPGTWHDPVSDRSHVGLAYTDGRWFVDPPPDTDASASGRTGNLHAAMRLVILAARALGWEGL